jgi:hypothetical protein
MIASPIVVMITLGHCARRGAEDHFLQPHEKDARSPKAPYPTYLTPTTHAPPHAASMGNQLTFGSSGAGLPHDWAIAFAKFRHV